MATLLILENGDTFSLENSDELLLAVVEAVNPISLYKGAIEPADVGSTGNELKSWKGAAEPSEVVTYSLAAASIESISEVGSPVIDTVVIPVYNLVAAYLESLSEVGAPVANTVRLRMVRLFRLTGSTDPDT